MKISEKYPNIAEFVKYGKINISTNYGYGINASADDDDEGICYEDGFSSIDSAFDFLEEELKSYNEENE